MIAWLWPSVVAAEPDVLGLTGGEAPIDFRGDPPPAEDCAGCHRRRFDEWSTSRHRASWSNSLMQAGFIAEPRAFCVRCHAPSTAQGDEVVANLGYYRSRDPRNDLEGVDKLPEPLADHGIDCAVCHWRGGTVLGARGGDDGAHDVDAVDALASGRVCRDCHEFEMPAFVDGEQRRTGTLMQSTWTEWTRYRDAGGEGTCVSCHMPAGAHTFAGAHDVEALARAVRVDVDRDARGSTFRIAPVGVGHELPTGDLFRRLTLEVDRGAGFATMATFGRRFETVDGTKRLAEDTSLRPDELRTVRVEGPVVAWRVDYHYGSENDERRGLVAPDDLVAPLAASAHR